MITLQPIQLWAGLVLLCFVVGVACEALSRAPNDGGAVAGGVFRTSVRLGGVVLAVWVMVP